jgi:hypothetical protein
LKFAAARLQMAKIKPAWRIDNGQRLTPTGRQDEDWRRSFSGKRRMASALFETAAGRELG